MSDKVIIGGVDVSKCSLYRNRKCINRKYAIKDKIGFIEEIYEDCNSYCDYGAYARAEEIQRLKAENEELKKFKAEISKPIYFPDVEVEVTNKYKQALEEVREIAKNIYQICDDECGNASRIRLITDKINEVLK